MPKAEVGSTKHLANKLKSKGLQRLRWYCQPCEKQCRDENGFKCHTQSESHVRQMMTIGANPNKAINDFSQEFYRDFILQLRTSHGTKPIHINHFYQEYIQNKEHVHMNSTKWPSLTEFAKYLGREGVCRVEETEKGLHIAWIDNSPEAMRRQNALRKRERQDKGDEEWEQRLIQEQIERAKAQSAVEEDQDEEARALKRMEGEKVSLKFSSKATAPTKPPTPPQTSDEKSGSEDANAEDVERTMAAITSPVEEPSLESATTESKPPAVKMLLGGGTNKGKNVFSSKKNPLAAKKAIVIAQPKKMSEAERIMREEIERKNARGPGGMGNPAKREKIA